MPIELKKKCFLVGWMRNFLDVLLSEERAYVIDRWNYLGI